RNPRQVSNTPAQDGNPAMMGVSYVLTPKSTHTTLSKTPNSRAPGCSARRRAVRRPGATRRSSGGAELTVVDDGITHCQENHFRFPSTGAHSPPAGLDLRQSRLVEVCNDSATRTVIACGKHNRSRRCGMAGLSDQFDALSRFQRALEQQLESGW